MRYSLFYYTIICCLNTATAEPSKPFVNEILSETFNSINTDNNSTELIREQDRQNISAENNSSNNSVQLSSYRKPGVYVTKPVVGWQPTVFIPNPPIKTTLVPVVEKVSSIVTEDKVRYVPHIVEEPVPELVPVPIAEKPEIFPVKPILFKTVNKHYTDDYIHHVHPVKTSTKIKKIKTNVQYTPDVVVNSPFIGAEPLIRTPRVHHRKVRPVAVKTRYRTVKVPKPKKVTVEEYSPEVKVRKYRVRPDFIQPIPSVYEAPIARPFVGTPFIETPRPNEDIYRKAGYIYGDIVQQRVDVPLPVPSMVTELRPAQALLPPVPVVSPVPVPEVRVSRDDYVFNITLDDYCAARPMNCMAKVQNRIVPTITAGIENFTDIEYKRVNNPNSPFVHINESIHTETDRFKFNGSNFALAEPTINYHYK